VDWEKKLKEAEENEKRILESESKTVRSNCLTQLLGRCAVQLHEKYTQNYLMPFTGKVVWVLFWSTCFLLLWFVGYVPDDAWNAKAIESVATVTSYDVRERQCSYECDCYQSCTGSGDSRSCTTRCSTLGMGNARYFWLLYWFSLLFWSIPCVVVLDAILGFLLRIYSMPLSWSFSLPVILFSLCLSRSPRFAKPLRFSQKGSRSQNRPGHNSECAPGSSIERKISKKVHQKIVTLRAALKSSLKGCVLSHVVCSIIMMMC
jgi:hypothetical protein